MSKIKAAIIFGGVSGKYETSLLSAAAVIDNIDTEEYETVCIGITKKGHWLYYPGTTEDIRNDTWSENPDCTTAMISPDPNRRGIFKLENGEAVFSKIDVIFPVLYGKNGEDGTIAGLLRMTGLPFVGSEVMASAACMDKTYIRMVLSYNNMKTSKWRMMFRNELNSLDEKCLEYASELSYPIIVKPANYSLDRKLNTATDYDTLKEAVKIGLAQDDKVVIEEFIKGKEIQIAVVGYENLMVSEPGEVIIHKDDFDFNSMFSEYEYIVPAKLDTDTSDTIKEMAKRAYKLMGCSDMARIDFYCTDDGDIILSQINTVPILTKDSMFVKLMENSGYSFKELISELITQAVDTYDGKFV